MKNVINGRFDPSTTQISPGDLPREGVLIMDACPVTALGMKRVLTEYCGITAPVNYVQSLAGIPAGIVNAPVALLIMDICGEKESVLDGLRLLANLRTSHPTMKMVICTGFTDHHVLELLVSSEANGILLKHEPVMALEQCVVSIMSDDTQWLSPKAKLLLAKTTSKKNPLTAWELDVLAYLFSGLSVSRVAQMLHRDTRTVSMHKRNAMAKLGFSNDSELFAQGTWMAKTGPTA